MSLTNGSNTRSNKRPPSRPTFRHELARHLLENEKRCTTGSYEISINRPESEVRVDVAALRVN